MRKNVILVTVVVAGLLLAAGNLQAAQQVRKGFTIPASFVGTIEATGCLAAPGPQVTVEGSLTPVGVDTEVIFTNPSGAPNHQERTMVSEEVVPANQPVSIPERSVVGAVSSDPYIWIQLTEQNGKPLTSEIFLGQCSQGLFNAEATLQVPVEAFAEVAASGCETAGASSLVLSGDMQLQPIFVEVIFRNAGVPTGPKSAVEMALLPTGQTYPFPQQEVTGGTTANPLISLQFRQDNSVAIGSEIRLGRCASLAN